MAPSNSKIWGSMCVFQVDWNTDNFVLHPPNFIGDIKDSFYELFL